MFKNVNKSMILPILSFIAFVLKTSFQISIPEDVLNGFADAIVNVLLMASTIYGIIKNHQKAVVLPAQIQKIDETPQETPKAGE